jgi:ribosome maturation factor RimP
MASTEGIRGLAESVLASAGLELWDVQITRDVVRVLVDRPGGVDLAALSAASSVLSPLLDAHPELAPDSRYQLEVSSPGVERTLRTPEHYRRYLDSDITIKTTVPVEGARRHRGRLLEAGETSITLEPAEGAGTRLEIRYEQIDRARTVLVWGPGSGPFDGGGRGPGRSGTRRAATALNSSKDTSK